MPKWGPVVREKLLQLLSYLFLDKFKIPTKQTWSEDSANAGQLAVAGLGADSAATGGDVGARL